MFENDYTINGKHATYLKYLAVKNAKEDTTTTSSAQLFERYIDVYMNAAIWGLLYSRKADRDSQSTDRARIYADAFAKERETCIFLYRLVMLLDKTTDLTSEERIDRAFRYDTQPEKKKEFEDNMRLFNSYVLGGIELMYEHFTDGCSSRDDYLDNVYRTMLEFQMELDDYSFEEELAKLLK